MCKAIAQRRKKGTIHMRNIVSFLSVQQGLDIISTISMMGSNCWNDFLKSTTSKSPITEKHWALVFHNSIFTTLTQKATRPFSQLSSMYCQANSSWSTHSRKLYRQHLALTIHSLQNNF